MEHIVLHERTAQPPESTAAVVTSPPSAAETNEVPFSSPPDLPPGVWRVPGAPAIVTALRASCRNNTPMWVRMPRVYADAIRRTITQPEIRHLAHVWAGGFDAWTLFGREPETEEHPPHCVFEPAGLIADRDGFRLSDLGGVVQRRTGPIEDLEPRPHCPHETPIDLARLLVRIITRPGDTVFDPFAGLGGIGVACVLEGRGYVGAEQHEDRAAYANRRIAWWKERRDRVAPLNLQRVTRILTGPDVRGSLAIRLRLPVRLRRVIEDSGCSLPSTVRAALCSWLALPLSKTEDAAPFGSVGVDAWLGRQRGIEVALGAGVGQVFEARCGDRFDPEATAYAALQWWTTGVEPEPETRVLARPKPDRF